MYQKWCESYLSLSTKYPTLNDMTAKSHPSKLAPGETSIERVTPRKTSNGYVLVWRICDWNGVTSSRRTQADSVSEVRRRAKAKAAELLAPPSVGGWTLNSPVQDYMREVTLPAIHKSRLAPATSRRYEICYRLLLGECAKPDCKHEHDLHALTIREAMRPRTLKTCLEEIAQLHGLQNAKHCKIILRKYVFAQLKIDELVETNPLADLDLDFEDARAVAYHRGGRSLSLDEYKRVITYLLSLDPEDIESREGKQGRWRDAHLVRERSVLIDFILTQATTGMRTNELATRTGASVEVDGNFNLIFSLTPEETKTKVGRKVPVLDPRVSRRIAARVAALEHPSDPIFAAPSDPARVWEASSRNRRLASFYRQMAADLHMPVFEKERGHFWRATLNTLLYFELPEGVRTRLLGHTAAVNRSAYTAITSTDAVIEAASVLR